MSGSAAPLAGIGEQAAHPVGQIGRERKLAALVGRHLGIGPAGARYVDFVFGQRLVAQDFAGEHEGVARHHGLDEILLDLAEQLAAARDRARIAGTAAARPHEADLDHVGFHDGADVEAVALRHARIGDAPASVRPEADLGEALVALERIAAGGDEIDDRVEILARKPRIGCGGAHFRMQLVGAERLAAGAAEHMLGEHVERARAQRRAYPAHWPRSHRSPRDIPAPRTGWPEPGCRARAPPGGDWRARCAG